MPHAASLALPADLLDALPAERWFAGKARRIREVSALDCVAWAPGGSRLWLVEVVYADGGRADTYLLIETLAGLERLLDHFFQQTVVDTARGGRLSFRATTALHQTDPQRTRPIELLGAEQSNTSVRFGDALIFKLFRRIQLGGENPEVEIGRFLTQRTAFTDTPAVAGALEYAAADGSPASFGLLQRFVPNRGDAWRGTLARLECALAGHPPLDVAIAQAGHTPLDVAIEQARHTPLDVAIEPVRRLGVVTAKLHLALASDPSLPSFAPEAIDDADTTAWRAALEAEIRQTLAALRDRQLRLDVQPLLERAAGLDALRGARKTRHHGDYHLGQVLERLDGGFAIIDFEGEPSRPLAARKEKRSPLRDVAGLLRSLDYARHAALRASGPADPERVRRADDWHVQARSAFLDGYLASLEPAAPELLPAPTERLHAALSALELEKAAYEVRYELSHRPDWLPIPLAALQAPG